MSKHTGHINRRQFLHRSALAGLGTEIAGRLPLFGQARSSDSICDVLVCSATPGGIAAAISAARLGQSVILAEYEDHIGGIVTNGLTNTDLDPNKRNAVGGFFNEYSANVLAHYTNVDPGGPGSPNVAACRQGFSYEAKVAEAVFGRMLAAERGVQVLLQHELRAVQAADGRVRSAEFFARATGETVRVRAKVFIDATYEGDLAAMAKCPYRVGRESRSEYHEPHAGRIYMRFGTSELQPGSTGEGDKAIQAFCFRFLVTKKAESRAPILKPATYTREDYKYLLIDIAEGRITKFEEIFGIFPLPNAKIQLNSLHPLPKTGVPSESLDLAEENWAWPEASPAQRRRIYERYRDHNVGLLWMLQNDPAMPASLRDSSLPYGWCRDEWEMNGNIPRQVYMREARRINGLYNVTENDGNLDASVARTQVQPDSIAVVQWEFDSHGCHKFDPAHPGVREGYTFVPHPPLQVPYGTVVPRGAANVLVPVACSTSHIAYNALRMEPVFMALGEASGVAAHLAIRPGADMGKVDVGKVRVAELQQVIAARGGVIAYLADVKFSDPDFAALQWVGARGFNKGYEAKPDQALTAGTAAQAFGRVMRACGKSWDAPAGSDAPLPGAPLTGTVLRQWLRSAGYASGATTGEGGLTVRQTAAAMFQAMTAADKKS